LAFEVLVIEGVSDVVGLGVVDDVEKSHVEGWGGWLLASGCIESPLLYKWVNERVDPTFYVFYASRLFASVRKQKQGVGDVFPMHTVHIYLPSF
jgi:hypothetical protein